MDSGHAQQQRLLQRLWPLTIPLILVLLSLLCGWWVAQQADRNMRQDLLLQARLIRQALNVTAIENLAGSASDLESPYYLRLKAQLTLIRHVNPRYRFVYLMGRRSDGRLFFYVDSEPPDSQDYSPPGQAYPEASPSLYPVFKDKAELVVGPNHDRWGTWVSALVPITDPLSGRLVAVMGMDADAASWRLDAASQAVLPVSFLLTLTILLTSAMIVSRSQRRLRESEAHYKTLVENPGQAIDVIQDGVIRYANPYLSALVGYSIQELQGRAFEDFLHPDDRDQMLNTYQKHQTNGSDGARVYRTRCLAKDGSLLWAEVHAITIKWQGRPATLCFITNLTDQIKVEAALRESENKYRKIFENIQDVFYQADLNGKITEVSPSVERITGYSRAELLNQATTMLYCDPADRSELVKMVTQNGAVDNYEIRMKSKDGRALTISANCHLLLDAAGVTIGIEGLLRDISERKQTEEQFRQISTVQTLILENSTLGIALVRNRIFEWVNARFCELLMLPPAQLQGCSTQIIYPNEEAWAEFGKIAYLILACGERADNVIQLKRSDGSLFWGRFMGGALNPDNPQDGSIWMLEDITERKQAEEQLQQLSAVQKLILDNSSLGIALVRNRIFEWVNASFGELLLWPLEVLQGSPTRLIYPSDEVYEELGQSSYPTLARGERSDTVIQLKRSDGALIWGRLMGKALNPDSPQDGSIWMFEDITARKLADEALQESNQKLSTMVEALEKLGVQNHKLRELGGLLMSSSRIADLRPVVQRSMQIIFPGTSGALYLKRPTTATLEGLVSWGDFSAGPEDSAFGPEDCWGLKRCGLHMVDRLDTGLVCRHVEHQPVTAYACLPLMARSEVLGLLHVRGPADASPALARGWLDSVKAMADELAELLSMSISNLRLQEKLEAEAIRDPLTKLYNRRYMDDLLRAADAALYKAKQNGRNRVELA